MSASLNMQNKPRTKIGDVYGRLTVIAKVASVKTKWLCQCSCNSPPKEVFSSSLRSGATKSCGCYGLESLRSRPNPNKTHGMGNSSEYGSWLAMINRCYNEKHIAYKDYGGRGISVCDEWLGDKGFEAFYAYMGDKPVNKRTLDRINNDGNYEPGNVRWASRKEQQNNRRNTITLTVGDITMPIVEWSFVMGTGYTTLMNRKKSGFTDEEAVYTPYPAKKNTLRSSVPVLYGEFYM